MRSEHRPPALEQRQRQERRRVTDDMEEIRVARGPRDARNPCCERARCRQGLSGSTQVEPAVVVLAQPTGHDVDDRLAPTARVGQHVKDRGHRGIIGVVSLRLVETSVAPPRAATNCACCDSPLAGAPAVMGVDRHHGTPGSFVVARCRSCGAGTTSPQVGVDGLTALYPTHYSPYELPAGALARVASWLIRRLQARAALSSAPLGALRGLAPGRGVDVGCGRGDLAGALVARGWQMTGVEPSAVACGAAASRGVDARTGTLADIKLDQSAYDFALFNHSLEHVEEPAVDLAQAAAALRPGGRVLVTVPNFGGWQSLSFCSRWFHLDLPRHRVHFTRAGLGRALERAGLEPIELTTSSSSVGLAGSLQYLVAGRCLSPTGMGMRLAVAASAGLVPLLALLDRRWGEGDLLHAVARKPRRAIARSTSASTRAAGAG